MSTLVKHNPLAEPILVEELPAEITAWEVCRKLAQLPHLLFLDSAQAARAPLASYAIRPNPYSPLPAPHLSLARYSFVTADPFLWLRSKGRRLFACQQNGKEELQATSDPFALLEEKLREFPTRAQPDLPPFQGGAAGLFGYDLCQHLERLPHPAFDDFAVPDLAVGFYDWVAGFDHQTKRAYLIATGYPEKDLRQRRQRARRRLEEIKDILARPAPRLAWQQLEPIVLAGPHFPVSGRDGVFSNFNRELYLQAVRRAIEYVHAGDCFQVNIAQRLLMPATLPPLELYDRLRRRNPAPFAGYFDLGEFVLASASPERFLRLEQGEVETRPIKGTRPRGSSLSEDQASAFQLQASAKDRAENVMIVDLLRNDLGRVCRFGSVRVEALCRLESYAYVHHLVSEVRGLLREVLGAIDLLRATFPGGSVTGAPKIRAMEIITELERTARGPYCGCLGYIGFDGSMDTNLLIRTFTIGKGWMQVPVGGGIVADSDPNSEYAETWHKAEGMLAVREGEPGA
jgi:para-aminobenzoate synthetase component 1